MYRYKFVNNNLNNCNNILNNHNVCVSNDYTNIRNGIINSINCCNNIFENLINEDINKQQFCNYNNFSKDFGKINYNSFTMNNIN